MACTRDILNITTKSKKDMDTFISLFKNFLKKDFYDNDFEIREDNIIELKDCCWTSIQEEPMFTRNENGVQIEMLIKEFVKQNPKTEISLDYSCLQMNCGETLYLEYEYNGNGKTIEVVEKFANDDGIHECWNCDEYFEEALLYIEDFEDGKEYECPNCGTKLSLEGYVKKYTIEI